MLKTEKVMWSLVHPSRVKMTLTDTDPEGKKIEPVILVSVNGVDIGLIPLKSHLTWLNLMMPQLWLPQIITPLS